jgi:S1-C subfamily serine protease
MQRKCPRILAVVLSVLAAAAIRAHPRPAAAAPAPAIVVVISGGGSEATGFTAGRGRVLTVAHVLDGIAPVTVRTADGKTLHAAVRDIDERLDLALLSVAGLPAPRLKLARADDGEVVSVLLAGRAAARARVRRHIEAEVERRDGSAAPRPALDLAATIHAGDSGSPVVTRVGGIAGVVFARSDGRPHTAYAVDVAALRAFLGRAG